jgi:hypothetical protein
MDATLSVSVAMIDKDDKGLCRKNMTSPGSQKFSEFLRGCTCRVYHWPVYRYLVEDAGECDRIVGVKFFSRFHESFIRWLLPHHRRSNAPSFLHFNNSCAPAILSVPCLLYHVAATSHIWQDLSYWYQMSVSNLALLGRACLATTISMAGESPLLPASSCFICPVATCSQTHRVPSVVAFSLLTLTTLFVKMFPSPAHDSQEVTSSASLSCATATSSSEIKLPLYLQVNWAPPSRL